MSLSSGRMFKQDAKTCWEFWDCNPLVKDKCPAFNSRQPCWHVASGYCGRVTDKQGMEKCFTCDWYRLKHHQK